MFDNVVFQLKSGGRPGNTVMGVVPVSNKVEYAYSTVCNGNAFKGEIVVLCHDTKTLDKNGRTIYVTPEGKEFVWNFVSGNPDSFDFGQLVLPTR